MNKKGFTLIELLLVVLIIGFMLAVIIPRGLRATTDAKYNLVRQNAAELGAYGNDWVEQQILAQDIDSTASRVNYLDTLVSRSNGGTGTETATWIAERFNSNWNKNATPMRVIGRNMNNATNQRPENSVQDIIEPAKFLRNPFNGADIMLWKANYPALQIIPGAIACTAVTDNSTGGAFDYYAFVFQGTDSSTFGPDPGALNSTAFHAGMDTNVLSGLRQGVFFTKVRQ